MIILKIIASPVGDKYCSAGRQPWVGVDVIYYGVGAESLPERSITPTVMQNATLTLAPIQRLENSTHRGLRYRSTPGYNLESLRDSVQRIFGQPLYMSCLKRFQICIRIFGIKIIPGEKTVKCI